MPENKLPRHVAIIMDGNGRWATQRRLPRTAGHKIGVDRVEDIVDACDKRGVEALTLFAFSSENWKRPQEEVGLLMNLFITVLKHRIRRIHKRNVRLRVIGDITAFAPILQDTIRDAETLTRENTGMHLVIAANYGGKWDISESLKRISQQVVDGTLSVGEITPELITEQLCIADIPAPDLFIRTGGEQRISNFLLWQLAYTELYFTDMLWPEFVEEEFEKALSWFDGRQRRFGRTSQQVEDAVKPLAARDGGNGA